ncbi:hypothetical protein N7478_000888 [Penicillium angulare]|uniref:uncharacterized protein n=1 Tax=Penicillium angulare TaxID=116970 RepID=UPI002540A3FA|nr:uncharacterized protein N7478_000888 [Penicillium angulare]KAJ5291637.1 hypothetical protein N7478_000888 [Penicillium angulare]
MKFIFFLLAAAVATKSPLTKRDECKAEVCSDDSDCTHCGDGWSCITLPVTVDGSTQMCGTYG